MLTGLTPNTFTAPAQAGGFKPNHPNDLDATASFRDIQSYIQDNRSTLASNKPPYVLDGNLHFPNRRNLFVPRGAQALPVTTGALRNLVNSFIEENPKQAGKNLVFLADRGPLTPPGHVAVTAKGSGLELFYRVSDGKPMGS
jgi:hypothetical protein